MNSEDRRLQTFRRWPHPQNWVATPLKLAKSGFYLNPTPQYPDRVVCFCCGIALVHWNRTHDPWTEHAKRSPICGLITGAYNAYNFEQKRLASYTNWPLPTNFAATPAKLAMAGFFHCPSSVFVDRCVCFCCGIALVRWEKNDDPWTEHVKHSRTCPFVRGKEVGNVPIAEDQPEEQIESTLRKMVEQLETLNVDVAESAPSYFLCPITQDFFLEPVVAEDGHSYEREAIKKWFESHATSPLTNKRLYSKRCIPNHNLRAQLIEYCEKLLAARDPNLKNNKTDNNGEKTTSDDIKVTTTHEMPLLMESNNSVLSNSNILTISNNSSNSSIAGNGENPVAGGSSPGNSYAPPPSGSSGASAVPGRPGPRQYPFPSSPNTSAPPPSTPTYVPPFFSPSSSNSNLNNNTNPSNNPTTYAPPSYEQMTG